MGTWSRIRVMCMIILTQLHRDMALLEPKFDTPMVNVTAREKATAELPCSVSSLGTYQVVWTDQFSTLLTYEDRRIIDDERLSVERPYTRDWNLHIRDVRFSDQGIYNCQINTNPVKVKTVNLIVLVPAQILDQLSTSAVTVREGETVNLVCNVTGTPPPTVTWYRLATDSKAGEKQKVGINGEVLIIHNVTRTCGDNYECVAFNGVPPAVSRVIQVSVEFAPEIKLPNKRIGQEKGKETILECTVTAFPHAVTMWQKDGVKIVTSTLKYRVEVYDEEKDSLTLSLRIFNIQESDFGTYTCVASNPLGEDRETMLLYDYAEHTRTTSTTASTTTTVDVYIQATPRRIFESPLVHLNPAANSDHQWGHELGHGMENQVTHRPVYTPPYRSNDYSGMENFKTQQNKDTRVLASKGTQNSSSMKHADLLTVAAIAATVATTAFIKVHQGFS